MAKIRELRDLGDPELLERLESDKEELFNLRFQLATGQLDNPMRIKAVRHEVARILTILREREMEVELEALEARLAEAASEAPGAGDEAEPAEEEAAPAAGRTRRGLRRKRKEDGE
jgi:large subunit ribosomal protein L29